MHSIFNRLKRALVRALPGVGKYKFHVITWSIVLVYFVVAPDIYAFFSVQQGRPVALSQTLPNPSLMYTGTFDGIGPFDPTNQDLQYAWGWSDYMVIYDEDQYEHFLVLKSWWQTYFFPLESVERQDVQDAFPEMDRLHTGYAATLSKSIIRPGEYTIGILARHRSEPEMYYNLVPLKKIIRTPNQIRLEVDLNPPVKP